MFEGLDICDIRSQINRESHIYFSLGMLTVRLDGNWLYFSQQNGSKYFQLNSTFFCQLIRNGLCKGRNACCMAENASNFPARIYKVEERCMIE